MILTMKLLKDSFGVCRLDSKDSLPNWATIGEFYSISKSSEELSIVCNEENIPVNIKCERDWRALKVEGPLDFALVGILSSIAGILAKEKISIFAISTYDTDYILVKEKDINKSIDTLKTEGYNII